MDDHDPKALLGEAVTTRLRLVPPVEDQTEEKKPLFVLTTFPIRREGRFDFYDIRVVMDPNNSNGFESLAFEVKDTDAMGGDRWVGVDLSNLDSLTKIIYGLCKVINESPRHGVQVPVE